jgi:peptidoglycan-N-acetylglucosamine deacetylase
MRRSRRVSTLLVVVASFLCGVAARADEASRPEAKPASSAGPRGRVALTFDDLPAHAALPPGMSRADVARSVLGALEAHHTPPTYGFVNAKALEEDPATAEVLRLWRAAGHPLANHTFSHMDLDTNTVASFEKDLLADEPTLRKYMDGGDWHWLRYPYLHEGDTLEKRDAVRRLLRDHGYRIAQVTISFDDYAYNDPYARCAGKGDRAAIDWMKDSYVRRAGDSITAARESARRVYGHDIPHVMLLHIGAFETVMLEKLLEIVHDHGLDPVTLDEAESDPAYAVDPGQTSGGTLLDQMMAMKGIARPASTDDTLKRLDGLCR